MDCSRTGDWWDRWCCDLIKDALTPSCLSSRRCDRRNDCGDYSDERGCSYPPCHDNQFTCQNGRCISKFFVCDEDNDCGDGSDEQEHLCHTPEPTCPPHQFRCDNGNCIDLGKVCNHLDDCSDNSDEKGCGESRAGDGTVYILHPFGLLRTFQYVFYVENLQNNLLWLLYLVYSIEQYSRCSLRRGLLNKTSRRLLILILRRLEHFSLPFILTTKM